MFYVGQGEFLQYAMFYVGQGQFLQFAMFYVGQGETACLGTPLIHFRSMFC